MPAYSLDTILSPLAILEQISRFNLPGTTLSNLLGFGIGAGGPVDGAMTLATRNAAGGVGPGGNTRDWDLRSGSYDVFDNTRKVAQGSIPDSSGRVITPQRVGTVQFTIPRAYEMMVLSYERLQNIRRLGGPGAEADRDGLIYIMNQERYLAQRFANMIELQAAGVLLGSYYFKQVGDKIYQTLWTAFSDDNPATIEGTADFIKIDYQIPDANKGDALKTPIRANINADWNKVVWTDTAAPIVTDIVNLRAHAINVNGFGIDHVIVRAADWVKVLNNVQVRNLAGGMNQPFEVYESKSPGEFIGKLRALPWLTWHVVDYGLEMWNGTNETTFKPLVPKNTAIFLPTPNAAWCQYIRGGEHIVEGPNGNRSFQHGFYSWSYPEFNPAGRWLCAIHNGLPALPVPSVIYHMGTNEAD